MKVRYLHNNNDRAYIVESTLSGYKAFLHSFISITSIEGKLIPALEQRNDLQEQKPKRKSPRRLKVDVVKRGNHARVYEN